MNKLDFFNKYYPEALKAEQTTNIPALVVLAQAAIESGWGEKIVGNMVFGIKAGPSWKGKKQLITTREVLSTKNAKFPTIITITPRKDGKYTYIVKDWFRAYDTPAESFIDHGKFLNENKRYQKAFEVTDSLYYKNEIAKEENKKIPHFAYILKNKMFADIVAAAGYSTDPTYASVMNNIINSLSKFLP